MPLYDTRKGCYPPMPEPDAPIKDFAQCGKRDDDRVLTQMVENMGGVLRSMDTLRSRVNDLVHRLGVDWTPSMELDGLVETADSNSPVLELAGQIETANTYLTSLHGMLTGLERL